MTACLRSISMRVPLVVALAMGCVFPLASAAVGKEEAVAKVMVPARYASELPECDRVEVFLLGAMQGSEEKDTFPIRPNREFAKVEKMREVKGEAAKKLCAAWRGLTFDYLKQAMCHFPVYGVRFYAADKLHFETSICFGCSNFYYPREGGGSSWHGFQTKDEAGKALRAALEEVIPPLTPEEAKAADAKAEEEKLKRWDESLNRYEKFLRSEFEGDVARMKTMMEEVKASDPKCEWLPDMEVKLAFRSGDWEGMVRSLESMPAGGHRDGSIMDLYRAFMTREKNWDGASKEAMVALAKACEEVMGRRMREGIKPVAGEYLVLCRMYWRAGDKKTALERVREAGKMANDPPAGPYDVMVKRYVESVEAGTLPTREDMSKWGEEEAK